MRRRDLILIFGGALVVPCIASAQKFPRVRRVGELVADPQLQATFREGLRELGHTPGADIIIETRSARGTEGELRDRAGELVGLPVATILVDTTPALRAVQQITRSVPIVMAGFGDPVSEGFVASIAHPRGNVTGLSWMTPEAAGKRLELLEAALQGLARVAVLADPSDAVAVVELRALGKRAQSRHIDLEIFRLHDGLGLEREFAAMTEHRVEALIVLYTARTASARYRIVDLAMEHHLPVVSEQREFAEAGGLLSYGPRLSDFYKRTAYFVDRILKGASAGDLAIEQPTQFELVVNQKSAKALGVMVPQSVLLLADDVIE